MPKKQMKFKDGGRVKHYYTGGKSSLSSADSADGNYSNLRGTDLPPIDDMESIKAGVRRALAGERPPAPQYTLMPSPKIESAGEAVSQSPTEKKSGLAGAVKKVEKSTQKLMQDSGKSADELASASRRQASQRAKIPYSSDRAVSQIPGQSLTAEQREGIDKGERVTGTELGRNVSNTLSALTPLGGGVGKVGAELAMGNRAAKAAQASKMSPAGQRMANMEEVRRVAMPGRAEAVMNPSAWAGGPKAMDKIAQVEARAAQAEAKAAQAAARKKAAQAKKDAKDPVMNARPGSDKANSGYKYESDDAFPPMYKKGGTVKKFAKGGSVSSASSRADGCAIRGKTKGMISKMKSGGMYGGKGAC
jgi:hypothetical protein